MVFNDESQLTCLKCNNPNFRITIGIADNVQILMSHCTECKSIFIFSTMVNVFNESYNKNKESKPVQFVKAADYSTRHLHNE